MISIQLNIQFAIQYRQVCFFSWFLQWKSSSVARACEYVWVYVWPGFERVFIVYIYVCQECVENKKKEEKKTIY